MSPLLAWCCPFPHVHTRVAPEARAVCDSQVSPATWTVSSPWVWALSFLSFSPAPSPPPDCPTRLPAHKAPVISHGLQGQGQLVPLAFKAYLSPIPDPTLVSSLLGKAVGLPRRCLGICGSILVVTRMGVVTGIGWAEFSHASSLRCPGQTHTLNNGPIPMPAVPLMRKAAGFWPACPPSIHHTVMCVCVCVYVTPPRQSPPSLLPARLSSTVWKTSRSHLPPECPKPPSLGTERLTGSCEGRGA